MKDDQNVSYLGKDLSQLLDEKLDTSRSIIKEINISEEGKKIIIEIILDSFDYHRLKIVFFVESYDSVFLSLDLGEKSIRVKNKMKRFSPEMLEKYFYNLDRVLLAVSKRRGFKEGLRLEEDSLFVDLLDKVNDLLLF